jgi:hypothetical protein
VPTKLSAYLQIYNDWDFLAPMLRSIAPYVDELVVMDGAYAWMADFLERSGRNPLRSDARVFDALEDSRIPYRVITKLWKNEIEKRMAGYTACEGRYVLRIDADEVMFFDDAELERFFSKGSAIAQVELPSYIAPGWLKAIKSPEGITRLPRAPILFDSNRITPDIHLNYLWLVLGSEPLPNTGGKPAAVHLNPVGFSAHLTGWRQLAAATQRAEFYLLLRARKKGVMWLKELKGKSLGNLSALFDFISPEQFRDILQASKTGAQRFNFDDLIVVPTPLMPEQEASFLDCHTAMMDELAALNRSLLDTGLHFATNWPLYIDISSADCFGAVVQNNAVHFEFSCDVRGANASLNIVDSSQPWFNSVPLDVDIGSQSATVRLPESERLRPYLRRQIQLRVTTPCAGTIQHFRIG